MRQIGILAGCAALALSPAAALAGRGHRHHHRRRAHAAHHRGHHRAHAAHVLAGTETAHLRLIRQQEEQLYETGAASGPLRGQMRADLLVGSTFSGGFTIHTAHGSIRGHGTARPHGTGRFQSFRGTMKITGGTGRYTHIHGHTQLYGTFDRRTFNVTIHTRGRLSY